MSGGSDEGNYKITYQHFTLDWIQATSMGQTLNYVHLYTAVQHCELTSPYDLYAKKLPCELSSSYDANGLMNSMVWVVILYCCFRFSFNCCTYLLEFYQRELLSQYSSLNCVVKAVGMLPATFSCSCLNLACKITSKNIVFIYFTHNFYMQFFKLIR
jgi:hypothetical protein